MTYLYPYWSTTISLKTVSISQVEILSYSNNSSTNKRIFNASQPGGPQRLSPAPTHT